MQELICVTKDNKKLFVQYWNMGYSETVVYVHGGPGIGSWDFKYAAEKLSNFTNVVIFDQRGTLRSDSILENDFFSSELLIDDIEEIRTFLHIEDLVLIGHSYGGQLILRYAEKYHRYLRKLIYICPTFNCLLSMKNVYNSSIKLLNSQNKFDIVSTLNDVIISNDADVYINNLISIPEDVREQVYFNKSLSEDAKKSIFDNNITEIQWENGNEQQKRIFAEKTIYDDYLFELSKINIPSLLVVGDHDPICCKIQQEEFIKKSTNGVLEIIPNAGHLLYSGNAEELSTTVHNFLL